MRSYPRMVPRTPAAVAGLQSESCPAWCGDCDCPTHVAIAVEQPEHDVRCVQTRVDVVGGEHALGAADVLRVVALQLEPGTLPVGGMLVVKADGGTDRPMEAAAGRDGVQCPRHHGVGHRRARTRANTWRRRRRRHTSHRRSSLRGRPCRHRRSAALGSPGDIRPMKSRSIGKSMSSASGLLRQWPLSGGARPRSRL